MSEFIRFEDVSDSKMRTRRWLVINRKSGAELAFISWYAPWRQYCAEFNESAVFSAGCLKDIQEFVAKANTDRKAEGPKE